MNEDESIEIQSTTPLAIQGLKKGGFAFQVKLGELIEVATEEDRHKLRKAFSGEWYHAYYRALEEEKRKSEGGRK